MTKEKALENQLNRAMSRFEEILQEKKTDIVRDSAILRFEFTFDVLWKTLKEQLAREKGVIWASPNDCFREAYRVGIGDYSDQWIEVTKQRNEAVHTYKEELAEALYEKLPEFLKLFQELAKALKK